MQNHAPMSHCLSQKLSSVLLATEQGYDVLTLPCRPARKARVESPNYRARVGDNVNVRTSFPGHIGDRDHSEASPSIFYELG